MSVGNLPPHTTAIIKITYVTELAVDGEDVIFTLPNSIAPSKKEKALKAITQSEHETIKTDSDFLSGGFSVQVAVEMEFEGFSSSWLKLLKIKLLLKVAILHCFCFYFSHPIGIGVLIV